MQVDKSLNGWNEYKRLVLAELERLNQAVEKLREQSIDADKLITKELNELRESMAKTMGHLVEKGYADIKKEMKALDTKFSAFESQFHRDDRASSSWGFWGAIVGMVTSLIVAIISIITILSK